MYIIADTTSPAAQRYCHRCRYYQNHHHYHHYHHHYFYDDDDYNYY